MRLELEKTPPLFGADPEAGIVAVEPVTAADGAAGVDVFVRDGDTVRCRRESFSPFLVANGAAAADCPEVRERRALKGEGTLDCILSFSSWAACRKAASWFARGHGEWAGGAQAPCLALSDPVQQYLTLSGKTCFGGMDFESLRRMQVDIECRTTPGYDFCNAQREGDAIVAIGMADNTGWSETLATVASDEKTMLQRFLALVRERDPDVIEGHNIFNFDLPYLGQRCHLHGLTLTLGRGGAVAGSRPSRVTFAERSLSYRRFDPRGRHVVDTFFLAHAYDVSHRSLGGFGLKAVAAHFGFATADRTYIDGGKISETFDRNPERLLAYLRDDVRETGAIAELLSRSAFVQAQALPYAYQTVCVRGMATKVDALMIREYLRRGYALPMPEAPRPFAGGYADMFETGVVRDVEHCDVRSLYPSLMLARGLTPRRDELGVFHELLDRLRTYRLRAKTAMREAANAPEQAGFDALQAAFKILINSFYGYLGFAQGHFNDFACASAVAEAGRTLLRDLVDWMRAQGARPVEIDTDGVYFVAPPGNSVAFREALMASLPEGIEIEFDGNYKAMYSHKMKNYALLTPDGEVIIKGAALKSRGLEPFQRQFIQEWLRLKLEGRDAQVPALCRTYRAAMVEGMHPVSWLAKTETLQESPAAYRAKVSGGERARAAAYELALASDRDYRAGDQVAYYVTGNKKTVAVHERARLVADWDPDHRDENIPYYLAKLEALCKKFAIDTTAEEQKELAL